MDQEQKERVAQVLREKWKGQVAPCPMCRATHWTVGDGLVSQPMQEPGGGFQIGGPTLECLALICNNCGNTQLLNALVLGLGDLVETEQVKPGKK